MRLLIVEDSESVRDRLRHVFGEIAGVVAETAGTMQEARARLDEAQPDAVILDINLPDGSGLDLLRVVKEARPQSKVMMFSAYSLYRKRCFLEGADAFYDKPAEFQGLVTAISALARERGA